MLDEDSYLSRRLDAFTDAEVDDEPGEEQAANQVPLEGSGLVNAAREVQHVVPAGARTRHLVSSRFRITR